MNKRITEAFAKGKAFIPFVTCGDPSLDVTEKIVYAMEDAGADLIELGIPFSDPTAEGLVIQGANLRALSGGVTTDKVFDMVEKIRKNSSIPMVFMTYANVVFSYGVERFCRKAAEVGMDGMILPDVPFEEKEEFALVAEKYGLDLISLIAPTSHERISMIAKEAEGFVTKFEAAMDDDFNTADALAAIFELVKFANTNVDENSSREFAGGLYEELFKLSDVLGLKIEKKEEILDKEIEDLIQERQAARKAKDFKRADEIRDELLKKGIILKDTREGVKWQRA